MPDLDNLFRSAGSLECDLREAFGNATGGVAEALDDALSHLSRAIDAIADAGEYRRDQIAECGDPREQLPLPLGYVLQSAVRRSWRICGDGSMARGIAACARALRVRT
jgi:hypothetical protein